MLNVYVDLYHKKVDFFVGGVKFASQIYYNGITMQNKKLNLLLVAIFGATLIGCNGSDGGDTPPDPSGLKLNGKYVLSGTFGAVTNKNLKLASGVSADVDEDGWHEMPLGAPYINNYVYAKDRFVTAGDRAIKISSGGNIVNVVAQNISLFSDDGINWYKANLQIQPYEYNSSFSSCFSSGFNNAFYKNSNIYFDTTTNEYIMPCAKSNDGITWSFWNNQAGVPYIYGNNRYLTTAAVGSYDASKNGFYSLDGGANWLNMANTPFYTGNSEFALGGSYGLYFNSSKFISGLLYGGYSDSSAGGTSLKYKISSDGSNWQLLDMPVIAIDSSNARQGCSIVQAGNKFFCGFNIGTVNNQYSHLDYESALQVAVSNNGVDNWQTTTLSTTESINYSTLQYVNNQYFADCSSYNYGSPILNSYKVCRSVDGLTWSLFASSPERIKNEGYMGGYKDTQPILYNSNQGMRNLNYAMGKYFLFGDNGKIYYSSDNMQTWTQTVSGINVSNYNTFKSTTGLSFVLGSTRLNYGNNAVIQTAIAYSTDNAASFKMATVPTLDKTPRSIATSGSDYVVVGDAGTLLHSTDGITWTQVNISNLTTSDLTTVRYINGTYYAVGDLGYVLTSTNGTTWSATQVSANPRLMDIVYDNSKFFVVGYGGYIGYSSNATNWIRATTPNRNQVNALAFGSGKYVAVGNDGVLWTSTNGIQWDEVPSANVLNVTGTPVSLSSYNINSTVYDAQDGFVAVGNNGLIMKSADGVAWTVGNSSNDSYEDITQLN